MLCNVSLQVIPLVSEGGISPLVDKVIELIRESGVKYLVGPMETTMEGDLHQLLEIVEKAQKLCLEHGAKRVVSVVKIDCKPGGVTIEEKIEKYREGEAG
ncbi:MAG TPA: MTH1187 family thiamine-binding protein [Syntrophomonadaceae bacterium]|nr:MTH1187 family thiamine-binding protein [Syntrophomonadaceae bacterium]